MADDQRLAGVGSDRFVGRDAIIETKTAGSKFYGSDNGNKAARWSLAINKAQLSIDN